ncbi:MAG TPA: O-antigen ligase family protein [Bacteroidia bacterium]|nr:O-antigen ligase family protein [Bacteroidia bacterium]
MPTSNFLTSLPQFIIAGNWLLEGGLKDKMRRFLNNKAALVLCSFYIMHMLGLLYTSSAGMDYGLEDVRKKLPLLLLPFLFSTMGMITDKEKRIIMLTFMLAVTFDTFYGSYRILTHKFVDIRDISSFVDPVREGMMLVLSFFLLVNYVFSNKFSILSVVLLVWAAWMVSYLFIMQSLTCVIMVVIISIILLLIWAFRQIRKKKVVYGIVVLAFAGISFFGSIGYIIWFKNHYFPKPEIINFAKLDPATPAGNWYHNYPDQYLTENGHYVYIYMSEPELKDTWNTRSRIAYDSLDEKGNPVRATLIRYLASKGLRKDADGVKQLSQSDVSAIEKGIPNYCFNSLTSIQYRIYQIFWELRDYRHGGSANGHSLTQRFEFWQAAIGIIKDNLWAGVGTGDVRIAFAARYNKMHSTLDEKSRLRSHNQYLEIGVAFGIIGILWFIINLVYPAFKTGKIYTYNYFIFWIILMIAILTEDTLETQAGATFYAFFNAFFLFL